MTENITWHRGQVLHSHREKLLGQKGQVLWFTGLSGSGKSTICVELEKKLLQQGKLSFRLDGDNIRHGLNSDLGFSTADRIENIRRIGEVAKLMSEAGLIVLASFITPLRRIRQDLKRTIGTNKLKIIYVKADLQVCRSRDPKGLYQKVDAGEITEFTGISSPWEEPKNPFLVLDTEKYNINQCVAHIMKQVFNNEN
ncbi:MAG: adenylyl-sulfate kinase [Deltaproteobacteria bacterium]|jgi:adenylylsulfate kinase|nr:adenylyl-sulfate kinase [Deltaproteobacteria bacterium]